MSSLWMSGYVIKPCSKAFKKKKNTSLAKKSFGFQMLTNVPPPTLCMCVCVFKYSIYIAWHEQVHKITSTQNNHSECFNNKPAHSRQPFLLMNGWTPLLILAPMNRLNSVSWNWLEWVNRQMLTCTPLLIEHTHHLSRSIIFLAQQANASQSDLWQVN